MHPPTSTAASRETRRRGAGAGPTTSRRVTAQGHTRAIARFYDRVHRLYPLVDWFCAPARGRLIAHLNRLPAGRVLEIGVGPGRHLGLYRRHAVTAVDCSARMVASCRCHAPVGAVVRQMDGERLEFPNGSFDYVVLCHVLSVASDPARMLAEAHRVLRSGGCAFVVNHETPRNAWGRIEAAFAPALAWLRFRACFRVEQIPGIERFRRSALPRGAFGLIGAYALHK